MNDATQIVDNADQDEVKWDRKWFSIPLSPLRISRDEMLSIKAQLVSAKESGRPDPGVTHILTTMEYTIKTSVDLVKPLAVLAVQVDEIIEEIVTAVIADASRTNSVLTDKMKAFALTLTKTTFGEENPSCGLSDMLALSSKVGREIIALDITYDWPKTYPENSPSRWLADWMSYCYRDLAFRHPNLQERLQVYIDNHRIIVNAHQELCKGDYGPYFTNLS